MRDIIEHLEDGAETVYYEKIQPGGQLKCGCGKLFDPDKEGGVISSNPYAMPVCGDCFEKWRKQLESKKLMRRED